MARIWNGGAKPVTDSLGIMYFFRSSLSSLRFIQATCTIVCLFSLGNFKACGNIYQMVVQIQGEEIKLSQTSHLLLSNSGQGSGGGV